MSDPHQHDNANDHPTPSCCAPSAPHETPSKPQPAAAPNTTVSAPSRPTIALPGGTFLMGTDYRDAFPFDGEGPIRPVSLSPFRIDTYPVTNRDFAAFVSATNYLSESEHFQWSFVFWAHLPPDRPGGPAIIDSGRPDDREPERIAPGECRHRSASHQ